MKSTTTNIMLFFFSFLFLEGCAIDHANYVKNMEKLNASEYSRIQVGNVQNFTAVKMRVFDRKQQHELSNSNDPGIQAQIANHGNVLYYSDNTAAITLRFTLGPIPFGIDSSWDKYAIYDISGTPEHYNYIALGKSINRNGAATIDQKDYSAKITDKGDVIYYSDANETIKFLKRPMPNVETHPDWDAYYLSEDNRYGLYKSNKNRRVYRLFFIDENSMENHLDFMSMVSGFQSSQYGLYRAIMYIPKHRKWYTFDFIPTKKLICFDLARAYDNATNARNQELMRAALSAILIALGGVNRTTFTGSAQSNYNGYYGGRHWSGTGSHRFAGYARTYDYSYLSYAAMNYLDTAFKADASVDKIKTAIRQQQCGFDL